MEGHEVYFNTEDVEITRRAQSLYFPLKPVPTDLKKSCPSLEKKQPTFFQKHRQLFSVPLVVAVAKHK